MGTHFLVEQLLALASRAERRRFLRAHAEALDDSLAEDLKSQADRYLRSDIQRSLECADILLDMGGISGRDHHRALGLLAQANAQGIGLGNHRAALKLYEKASTIYEKHGRQILQAKAQVGKLPALMNLDRYEEALQIGQWAARILERESAWIPLANLVKNMGAIHGRAHADAQALAEFDRALALYEQHGATAGSVAGLEYDRAIVLRNLGRFEESIAASQRAIDMLTHTGQGIRLARARQSLGVTFFVLGRYNDALAGLEEAKDAFLQDGRQRDALLADLFISDCLLELRRFTAVVEKTRQIRALFAARGVGLEVGQALLNEAIAQAELGQYGEAYQSLEQARERFQEAGNRVWETHLDLTVADLKYKEGDFQACVRIARQCARRYRQDGLEPREALAHLTAARAAIQIDGAESDALLQKAQAVGERLDLPGIQFQAWHLLGRQAWKKGDLRGAQAAFDRGIAALERLRGGIMVEHRARFLEDKERLYQDAVRLCLELSEPAHGLAYAERAKSRALVEMLAHGLNLRLEPRSDGDRELVEALIQARSTRDQELRRWQSAQASHEGQPGVDDSTHVREEIQRHEARITALWHKLLVRNAEYARDAALWQVRSEPIQPYLDSREALLEYFLAGDELIAFLVSGDDVTARRLSVNMRQVRQLIQLFNLNLDLVPASLPDRIPALRRSTKKLLGELYGLLISPIRQDLAEFHRLTIVPHGPLHYLPFHALFDGGQYLLEAFELRFLPAASILRYASAGQASPPGVLALGHSAGGRLPFAVREAQTVADLLGGETCLEAEATLESFKAAAPSFGTLHLAAHGQFREDNPLFSSLTLADGWLTALDAFDLRLKAGLVTLSGCDTGRSAIRGGDELLGLMRAFLYAGAASLVMSLWVVDDRSTARWMEAFYRALARGETKAAAVREAQLRFLHPRKGAGEAGDARTAHPYYWAPFVLVGDAGAWRGAGLKAG